MNECVLHTQLGSERGEGDISSSGRGWHTEHLQHVATSGGAARQRLQPTLVVVRHYKLHSRCSGQHVLVAGRRPTARAPLHSQYGRPTTALSLERLHGCVKPVMLTRPQSQHQECQIMPHQSSYSVAGTVYLAKRLEVSSNSHIQRITHM